MSKPSPCPLCQGGRSSYRFHTQAYSVFKCPDCALMYLNPQPDDAALARIYSEDYFLGENSEAGKKSVAEMKRATAEIYLKTLLRHRKNALGKLLEVGCGRGDFLEVAQRAGFEVWGSDVSKSSCDEANRRLGKEKVLCGELAAQPFEAASFDAVAMFDVIEHPRDPVALLKKVHSLLKPGGTLFIVTPDLDSWSARLLRQNWMEFKPEHLFYFDRQNIQQALFKGAFEGIRVSSNTKVLTFDYLHQHFERFRVPFFSRAVALLHFMLPGFVKSLRVQVPSSGMNVLARAGALRARPLLSILIPVYNEAATFPALIQAVLDKKLPDVDKEIIIIESNSKDGTRDEVLKFKESPGIKVILEERPQGKGHAVRAGLKEATGDIVLIQDGDLEYDINDYDQLLEPILRGQAALVLGSRHSGSWKIRKFTDQPLMSLILNAAHYFFAGLLNLACGSRLRDPFTMYKIFRRDCVDGLTFRANRFDFDWEIMIKLLRKGYKALEISVNYESRSFSQGKKVSIVRDPITWIWALLRFRFCKLYE